MLNDVPSDLALWHEVVVERFMGKIKKGECKRGLSRPVASADLDNYGLTNRVGHVR
jgi:hypothetical protein